MMLCVGTYIMKKFLYSDRSSQLWLPWLSSTLPSWRHLSANCWNTTVRLRNFEKILAVQNFCSKGRKELCGRRPPKDHNAAAHIYWMFKHIGTHEKYDATSYYRTLDHRKVTELYLKMSNHCIKVISTYKI